MPLREWLVWELLPMVFTVGLAFGTLLAIVRGALVRRRIRRAVILELAKQIDDLLDLRVISITYAGKDAPLRGQEFIRLLTFECVPDADGR